MVYAIDNEESFQYCRELQERIFRVKESDRVPMVLVGNKTDLEERTISTEQGFSKSTEMNCGFIDTSALRGANVEEAFYMLARRVLEERSRKM